MASFRCFKVKTSEIIHYYAGAASIEIKICYVANKIIKKGKELKNCPSRVLSLLGT